MIRGSLTLCAAFGLACAGAPGAADVGEDEGEDETTGAGTGFTARPIFVDPADGLLRVDADTLEPIELRIRQITLGETQLLVDGHSLGPLPPGSSAGEIHQDRLVVRLHGALEAGTHSLSLFNPGVPTGVASDPVALEVEAVTQAESSLLVGFEPTPRAAAESIQTAGIDESAVMWWTVADHAFVTRPDASGRWDAAAPHELVALDAGTLSASSLGVEYDVASARVRAVWRTTGSGEAVTLRWSAGAWGAAPDRSGLVVVPDATGAEWSQWSAVRVEGGSVFALRHAPTDLELPRPGDWQVLHARWGADGPGELVPVTVSGGHDLEGFGPLVDHLRDADAPRVMLRVGGAWPGALEASSRTGFASIVDDAGTRPANQAGRFVAVAGVGGALGSRVALLATGTGIHTHVMAAWAGRHDTPALPDGLPTVAPRAPIAAASLGGRPVFGLAFGPAHSSWILVFGGARFRGIELGRSCDQLAFSTAGGGDRLDLDRYTLPIACLSSGDLTLGSLARIAD